MVVQRFPCCCRSFFSVVGHFFQLSRSKEYKEQIKAVLKEEQPGVYESVKTG